MKTWKLAILVGALSAATVTGVALALDRPGMAGDSRQATTTMVAQQREAGRTQAQEADATIMVAQQGEAERTQAQEADEVRGALWGLMQNEDFRADLWALQDGARDAMRAWWDEYGDDPTSDAAREALQTLREEQGASMQALLEKYGVDRADRTTPGCGRGSFGFFGARPHGGGLPGGGLPDPGPLGEDGTSGWDSSAGSGSATATTL